MLQDRLALSIISWTKSFVSRSIQITMPATLHSFLLRAGCSL